MDKEIVAQVVNKASFGNENLRRVMEFVCVEVGDLVRGWPNEKAGKFACRLVRASGYLVGEKLGYEEMATFREGFWKTEKGKQVNQDLVGFVQARGLK